MATTTEHREISARFLEQAEDELHKGDLLQASEKAWGAVAHYVKAVSEREGWPRGSHNLIRENAKRLIALTDDYDTNWLRMAVVEQLHSNFYEVKYTEDDVQRGLANANLLISVLKGVEDRV